MRRIAISIVSMLVLVLFTTVTFSQKMTWTTKSKAAKALALKGSTHFMNAEFGQAYQNFSEAIKLDPDFTVALVFMSNMTYGETRKAYDQRAIASAKNKTEGEKIFASTLGENETNDTRRVTWAKLHSMFPDGEMLGSVYVQTRATSDERFVAAEDYIKKFPNQPCMYNTIGYFYMLDKKDMDMAKKNLDKYLELYPEGSNPYDSMGEYYLNAGDTANAEKYYMKSLEKYPFSTSSLNALQKIKDGKKDK